MSGSNPNANPGASSTEKISLQVRRTFKAPRERVFKAWTEPEQMKQWWAPGDMTLPIAEAELRVGGIFRIGMREPGGAMHITSGVYREVVPNEKVSFTWQWEDWDDPVEMLVTLEFRDVEGGTELTLTHEFFPDEAAREAHGEGWGGCLDNLEKFLA